MNDINIIKSEKINLLCDIKTLCGEKISFFYEIQNNEIYNIKFISNGAKIFYIASNFICEIINNKKTDFYNLNKLEEYFWNHFEIKLIGERKNSVNNLLIKINEHLIKIKP